MNTAVDTATLEDAAAAACRAGLRAGLPEADARDLAQDALVRALTSAQPPQGVPLRAWVYGIARNLGRDHAKSAKRREVGVDEATLAAAHGSAADDLATVLAVRTAVESLPDALRDVITIHELEENSLRETAEALQIPFDTAKDRLRRAREQLRSVLGDVDNERAHTRRRAAAHVAAVLAGVYAVVRDSATAAAAAAIGGAAQSTGTALIAGPAQSSANIASAAQSTESAANVASTTQSTRTTAQSAGSASNVVAAGARHVPTWLASVAGGALLVAGFAAGRLTAPSSKSTSSVAVASSAPTSPASTPAAPTPPTTANATSPPTPVPSSHTSPPTATSASAATPSAVASTAAAPPPGATPTSAPMTAAATSTSPAPPARADEQLLLDRARVGLRRGMTDEALVTLMEHARRFPTGTLAEERDVLMIEAYVRAGNTTLARRRLEAYRSAYPTGILRARVDELAKQLPN